MIFLVFLIASLLAAALYAILAVRATLWGALAVFAQGWLAANLLYVLLLLVNALLLPKLAPGEGIERQRPLTRKICVWTARLLGGYAGIEVHLNGLEKMPEGRFLFVCNHRSGYDPLVVIGWLDKYNISFISKPSNLAIPLVGLTARHAGYLAIDRENNREALKTILLAADYLKRGVCNIGIYPEGTRSRTGELLPFHAGSFKIAQKAGVPVVVACSHGTENVKKHPFFRRVPVYLDVLEVIDAERAKAMPTAALAEEAKRVIQARLDETEGRSEA